MKLRFNKASFRKEALLNRNFTLRKFHVVKNWYQFLTAREGLVAIRLGFHTNISHVLEKSAGSQMSSSNYAYSSHR